MNLVCVMCKDVLKHRCTHSDKDPITWDLCFECDAKMQQVRYTRFSHLGRLARDNGQNN